MSDPSLSWLERLAEVDDSAFDERADAQFAGAVAKLRARRVRRWAIGGFVAITAAAVVVMTMLPQRGWVPIGERRATIALDRVESLVEEEVSRPRPARVRGPLEREPTVEEEETPPPSESLEPVRGNVEQRSPERTPRSVVSTPPPWREQIRDGRAAAALDAMLADTWSSFLRRATAEELLAVAQAARGARRVERARGALSEIRARFPEDELADQATFLLGRVEAELAVDRKAAVRWFERYVREYPRGQFVERARGRVLRDLVEHGTDLEARKGAADYLGHHPEGAYASLAKRVIGSAE